jgi:adenine specific DNA methylase Mod
MKQTYKGYLGLDWYNKDKSVLNLGENDMKRETDIPAPRLHWVNEDNALFYEIEESEGKGKRPYWVDRNDIRVKEPRALNHQKTFVAEEVSNSKKNKKGQGNLIEDPSNIKKEFVVTTIVGEAYMRHLQSDNQNPDPTGMLIKGDNLLALNTLVKLFENKPEEEKVKCIYIDPPFKTGEAFINKYYDDNLKHSEWLSLIYDRLSLLYKLLNNEGSLFIHIDDNEIGYILPLLDLIFGFDNRVSIITFKQGAATGHKSINKGAITVTNYIINYAKNKNLWNPNRIYTERDRDPRYGQFITNIEDDYKKWNIISLNQAFADSLKLDQKVVKKVLDNEYEERINEFVINNASKVIRTARPDYEGISGEGRKTVDLSKNNPNEIYKLNRENFSDMYFIKGDRILFYKDKLKIIDGQSVSGEPLTNLWDDLLSNNLHNEGNVDFPKGKKPEALIKRIIELSTNPGDLVLDCFGGSGTTFAVAHKMGRRWIGVEVGDHADTHIIPRMQKVLSGEDQGGISKAVEWKGGGSFSYYHLGESVISIQGKTYDFNWNLSVEEIAKSILYYFEYRELETNNHASLREIKNFFFGINDAGDFAIVHIRNSEKERNMNLTELELNKAIEICKKQNKKAGITLFTNCGVQVTKEVNIVKVPTEIVVEME